MRLAILSQAGWLFLPLFSYAYVSKTILFLSFWTLVNDIIDSRKAETLFPFIAGGGTLGAIVIAYSIPVFLNFVTAANLIVIWAGIVVVLALLLQPLQDIFFRDFQPKAGAYSPRDISGPVRTAGLLFSDLKEINREKVLLSMALVYFTVFFVLMSQHFTFYTHLKAHFSTASNQTRALASFLGFFNGTSMLVTFVLQNSVSRFILRRLGSTRTMYVLPAVMLAVFITLAILGFHEYRSDQPAAATFVFWGVVAGVGVRIAVFDAFFSPDFQLFFSSLSHSIRGKGKLFIEGMIKPLAIFSSAIWLVFVIGRVAFFMQMCILALLCIVTIYLSVLLRRAYTRQLTFHLQGFHGVRPIETGDIERTPHRTRLFRSIRSILDTGDPAVKRYAIQFLAQSDSKRSIQILIDHIENADSKTRSRIVSALARKRNRSFVPLFVTRLSDPYYRSVANSIEALILLGEPSTPNLVRRFLDYPNGRVCANTIIALWKLSDDPADRENARARLEQMLASHHDGYNASALYALGEMKPADTMQRLRTFYHTHTVFANRKVWWQFVVALGKVGDEQSLGFLLALSEKVHIKQKTDIAHVVSGMVQRGYPVHRLVSSLGDRHYTHIAILLMALNECSVCIDSEQDREALKAIAKREVVSIHDDLQSVKALRHVPGRSAAVTLFMDVIKEECIDEKVNLLLNIASLLDDSEQIRRVTHRIQNPNRHIRARALEVLDNTGYAKVNKEIIRILEDDAKPGPHVSTLLSKLPSVGKSSLHRTMYSLPVILRRYKECPNEWLRKCAAYVEYTMGE
jgi:hypothetical protein